MKACIYYILSLVTLTACNNATFRNKVSLEDSSKKPDSIPVYKTGDNFKTTEIICATVYSNKGYKLTLTNFDSTNHDETKFNSVFTVYKRINGKYLKIFNDSIFNSFQELKFEDFNNDKIKDILVQNISDVRSNLTYYLYLVDTTNDRLKKIKGFEEIKNPRYIPQYDLIDNYVVSGTNWTAFYKIDNGAVFDFDIAIDDDQNENAKSGYYKDYDKAIKTILTREKQKR